jgi:hypothetical protein
MRLQPNQPESSVLRCPLCQHTQFEVIELKAYSIGKYLGKIERWQMRKVKGFLSGFLIEKRGFVETRRCAQCHYILLFAEERHS